VRERNKTKAYVRAAGAKSREDKRGPSGTLFCGPLYLLRPLWVTLCSVLLLGFVLLWLCIHVLSFFYVTKKYLKQKELLLNRFGILI